ncbi:MAG: DUF1127 domain-containing protein [Sphingomonadales bacterium]|nr:DUF1127 domain-containing protein [Sphingomonadales bacterium]
MLTTHFVPAPGRTPRPLVWHLAGLGMRAWTTWRHKRAQQKTVRILSGLDCRTLKDIGVAPGEIESIVYGNPRDRIRPYRDGWQVRGGL